MPGKGCSVEGDFHLAGWLVQPLRDAIETSGQTIQLEPKAMDLRSIWSGMPEK